MRRSLGYLKTLIQGVAFVIFFVQIVFAVLKYNSKPAVISLKTKSLKDLDKPVLVSVCKESQFDYERAAKIGYQFQDDFFSGQISTGKHYNWYKILMSWCRSIYIEISMST
mgnify:FL=1